MCSCGNHLQQTRRAGIKVSTGLIPRPFLLWSGNMRLGQYWPNSQTSVLELNSRHPWPPCLGDPHVQERNIMIVEHMCIIRGP